MEQRRRIGVIMPAITESLDAAYLEGIYRQVTACGYDVIVFTCSSNMQKMDMPTAYILAEESIYRLAAQTRLDGLIVAAGKAGVIGEEHVREGQIVIDVGINTDENGKLCGDVKFSETEKIAGYITPVPGGVGSVTTSVLVRHVVDAAMRKC